MEKNYKNIDKTKIMEYIYELLYVYNNNNNGSVNPYSSMLTMKLENGDEFIIPEKIREDAIVSWHKKKEIEDNSIKFNYHFYKKILSTLFCIIFIILFLYVMSLLRFIVIR